MTDEAAGRRRDDGHGEPSMGAKHAGLLKKGERMQTAWSRLRFAERMISSATGVGQRRHVHMIALGGIIGASLFIGSGAQ